MRAAGTGSAGTYVEGGRETWVSEPGALSLPSPRTPPHLTCSGRGWHNSSQTARKTCRQQAGSRQAARQQACGQQAGSAVYVEGGRETWPSEPVLSPSPSHATSPHVRPTQTARKTCRQAALKCVMCKKNTYSNFKDDVIVTSSTSSRRHCDVSIFYLGGIVLPKVKIMRRMRKQKKCQNNVA